MNTFQEKAQKFLPILDEVYAKESVTSFLRKPPELFIGTQKVRRPMITMDGAGNYDRGEGYADGGIDVSYSEHTIAFDRGRRFNIDVIDDDESAFDLTRQAMVQFMRTKEVPEYDAVAMARFVHFASEGDGTVENKDTISDALDEMDEAERVLNDKEAGANRVAFVSNDFYKALKTALKKSGRWDMHDGEGRFNRKVGWIDDTPIIPVPKKRFYDTIELLDGKTGGEEAGGFELVDGTSREIHMIYADIEALEIYIKRENRKIISPDVNQKIDGYSLFYRYHHDAVTWDNKTAGIYVLRKDTPYSE